MNATDLLQVIKTAFPTLAPFLAGDGDALPEGAEKDRNAAVRRAIEARLNKIQSEPLTRAAVNQILHLCHQAGMSAGFFRYYVVSPSAKHLYSAQALYFRISGGPIQKVEPPKNYSPIAQVSSIEHLAYALVRFLTDALLLFGNARSAYRELRTKNIRQLKDFFKEKRIRTEYLKSRGPIIDLMPIDASDRYMVGEIARANYRLVTAGKTELQKRLVHAYKKLGGGSQKFRSVVDEAMSHIDDLKVPNIEVQPTNWVTTKVRRGPFVGTSLLS